MSVPIISLPSRKLVGLGLYYTKGIHYQSSPEELVAESLRSGEGKLSDTGALVIHTGEFTGRSPKDKFIVYDEITTRTVDWNEFNHRIDPTYYSAIYKKNDGTS